MTLIYKQHSSYVKSGRVVPTTPKKPYLLNECRVHYQTKPANTYNESTKKFHII